MLKFCSILKYVLVSAFEGPCELSKLNFDSGMMIEYRSQIPYGNDQDCSMNFVCPTDQVVVVDVKLFDIEDDSSCSFDYLSIDGDKMCGTTHPVISTSSNKIEIRFHSDDAYTEDGFKLHLGCKGM